MQHSPVMFLTSFLLHALERVCFHFFGFTSLRSIGEFTKAMWELSIASFASRFGNWNGKRIPQSCKLVLRCSSPRRQSPEIRGAKRILVENPGLLLSWTLKMFVISDASRRPPPTLQDFGCISHNFPFKVIQGNLSGGRCSLVRETAELVVK